MGFPAGSIVKNPPASVRDMGLNKIVSLVWEDPMGYEAGSLCITATEPVLPSPGATATEATSATTEACVP